MKPQRFIKSLTEEERQDIEKLFREGDGNRVRKRADVVRLSALGYSVTQISEILGCSRQSSHNWLNDFEAQGCQGLFEKPRSGRSLAATADYRSRLFEVINANPEDMGYPFAVWTITRIRAHMAREMGTLLSQSMVRQLIKEEGLIFKHPRHALDKKLNKDAFAKVREVLEQAKKSPWYPVPT